MASYINFLSSNGPGERGPDCPLCQERIEVHAPSMTHNDGSCQNTFCKSCFDHWVRYALTIPPTCPLCRVAIHGADLQTPDRANSYVPTAMSQVSINPHSVFLPHRFERWYGAGHELQVPRGEQQAARRSLEMQADRVQMRLDSVRRMGDPSVAAMRQILGWQDGFNCVALERLADRGRGFAHSL